MSVINSIPLIAAGDDGYQISRSVRLRSSASGYFGKTFATNGTGGGITVTFSAWVKRGKLGVLQSIIGADATSGTSAYLAFNSSDCLEFGQGASIYRVTSAVFRDPSAWYHIVWVWDSSNATDALRSRIYVNGSLQSYSTSASITLNTVQTIGYARSQGIGADTPTTGVRNFFDGYLTEVNFIDGQALTPSSFGETDAATGVWKPKRYAGTYGTNGFYLNFSDNSNNTAATIGKDSSGNGNNWTPNNISVTAGVTYDSMLDTPTPYADGGNGRGNYAVGNPLVKAATGTLTSGNLNAALTGGSTPNSFGSIGISSGKWYWEVTQTYSGRGYQVGIDSNPNACSTGVSIAAGNLSTGYGYVNTNGNKLNNNSAVTYGTAWFTSGQTYTIGVAFDADNGTLAFYLNGTSQGTAFTGLTSGPYFPSIASNSGSGTDTLYWNFGQRPFSHTPPTGFKALNTQNLPDATIKKGNAYFDVTLQTGNTTGRTVSGLSFQPDLVWVKNRAGSANRRWGLIDSVRGVNKTLCSNLTDAEVTSQSDLLTAFNSDGFTIGADSGLYGWNGYAESYVHFAWKESASAGFDIVTYTGNGANPQTVSHALGVAPKMILVKVRNLAGQNWYVYHASNGATPQNNCLFLDSTSASQAVPTAWNNQAPTSSAFYVGNNNAVNGNTYTYVAYLFSEVAGFSKFGSYTGNGSTDGPFVFCGFRPRWLMIKRTDAAGYSWVILDSSRDTYNPDTTALFANTSDADSTGYLTDFLSNGFKLKSTANSQNASGGTYIYAAFAENQFKNSLAR